MKVKNVVKIGLISMFLVIFMLSNIAFAVSATNKTENSSKTNTTTEEETTKEETSTDSDETKTTSSNKENSQEQSKNEESKAQTQETREQTKSSNANLSNLGIKPNDFSGFTPNKTEYDVTVPDDVDSIQIYATLQDSKAKILGTGTKDLNYGLNEFTITVTAEDGTTKDYILNITRGGEEENTENVSEEYLGNGLASLNIENLELSPSFDTNIYEYTVKYIGEKTNLDITAEATDPYYLVEVTGNEDLQEGENLITILVSDPDGENIATYQVTVNKSLVDEEALAREQAEKEKQRNIIIGVSIAVIIIAIIIIVIVKKHKKRNKFAENYTVPYKGINNKEDEDFHDEKINNYDEYDENDIPKSLKNNYTNDYDSDEKNENEIENRNSIEDLYKNKNNGKTIEEVEDIEQRKSRKIRRKGKRYLD